MRANRAGLRAFTFLIQFFCKTMNFVSFIGICYLLTLFFSCNGTPTVRQCHHTIFCYGRYLEAANHFKYFPDPKTIVDMPLKYSEGKTKADFDATFPPSLPVSQFNNETLNKFIQDHFQPAGSDLSNCSSSLPDWQPSPPKFKYIRDPHYRAWAHKLHQIWPQLCKKVGNDVKINPDRHTLLYVPYHYIAPGGRFRELYYWDTFWIIRGLLVSGMYQTSAGMIRNLAYLVGKLGFVPNGSRMYYEQRSQPPFLIPTVYEFYTATGNVSFVHEMLPMLYEEYLFWANNRLTKNVSGPDGKLHNVFQYISPANTLRPESFRQDSATVKEMNATQQQHVLHEINSGCETGWDFSSRWFGDNMNMDTIKTTRSVPVDLNAIMFWNMDILQFFFQITGNNTMSTQLEQQKDVFRRSLTGLFFNKTLGVWFDWDLDAQAQNSNFYPSMAVPLFTGAYQLLDLFKPEALYIYLNETGLLSYPGGIPTSRINSTQQWDFPNGWPPLNHIIIKGLQKSRDPIMQEAAYTIASKWVAGNYKIFMETGHMFEKYDVISPLPTPGSGGEYHVQKGFGWTNGVILDFLYSYGDRLVAPQMPTTKTTMGPTSDSGINTFCALKLLCTLFFSLVGSLFLLQ